MPQTARDRCITPSFSPSTCHHGKLMDGEPAMWSYIARRLLYAVPILLGVSMLVFALIHLAPGDVVDLLVPPEVPREVADTLRRRFALDQPIYIQYAAWLGRLLVGDLGISFFTNRPVADELFSALGNTLMLAI